MPTISDAKEVTLRFTKVTQNLKTVRKGSNEGSALFKAPAGPMEEENLIPPSPTETTRQSGGKRPSASG